MAWRMFPGLDLYPVDTDPTQLSHNGICVGCAVDYLDPDLSAACIFYGIVVSSGPGLLRQSDLKIDTCGHTNVVVIRSVHQ